MSSHRGDRLSCVVLGSGNIGTDLMIKLLRSERLQLTTMVGIDPESPGLARAKKLGIDTSHGGVDSIIQDPHRPDIVFDATSASAHKVSAPLLERVGIQSIDLTPAKLGPSVVPVVNGDAVSGAPDLNLITCGGQATIPIVHAVCRTTRVAYAEIVSTIASDSAGPGTRQNIDEFTQTTARGLEEVGGAEQGKAIIILNPAVPPLLMRNTVYCSLEDDIDQRKVAASIEAMVSDVQAYVPGYRLSTPPVFDSNRVAVFLEVEGAADYLPSYSGNLDIMTAAAVRVGEQLAEAKSRLTVG
jgi:acetaldehyde dehydrogenase (acetylating)